MDATDLVEQTTGVLMYPDNQRSINPRFEELHEIAQSVLRGTTKALTKP